MGLSDSPMIAIYFVLVLRRSIENDFKKISNAFDSDKCFCVYLVSRDKFHSSSDISSELVQLLFCYLLWNFFATQIIVTIDFSFAFLQISKKIAMRNKLQDNKRWPCKDTVDNT